MITVTDLFCGAGGSGLGATAVPGVELYLAANHSERAIETHALNFPDCLHDCADISQVEPRRYRRSNILWASPECTNHSVAKGRKRQTQADLFGEPLDELAERSRATMWDVPRFAEVHKYDAVVVENVVDAAKWPPFKAWLLAMDSYGYDHHIVYLNSMHAPAIQAPRAPQSRDRMYVVFWRKGNPVPNLDIRPLAYCPQCDTEVRAIQVFKKSARWGRYRQQYVYRCPNVSCRNSIVEPYALPAASVIEWGNVGQRIGDREKPLAEKTLARIKAGLERYARPMTFEATGNTFVRPNSGYARAWPVDWPTATLTTSETRALVVPTGGSRNEDARPVGEPFRTRMTREMEGLLIPMEGRDGKRAGHTDDPFRTQTARHETGLVVSYYGKGAATPLSRPLPTHRTHDTFAFIAELRGGSSDARPVSEPLATVTAGGQHHALVQTEIPKVDDCTFRMLTVPEIQGAMAFTPEYQITGSKREQVKQLGNAVTPPAAEWLIRAVVESLEGEAAA